MKFPKLLTLLVILILSSQVASAQVIKCRTTSFSYKTKNERTERWTSWSSATETDILITIDFKNDRIKIFSKTEQVYDIIKYYDKTYDSDGDEVLKFHCINEDGLKCYVRLLKLNSQNGRRQLYVDFSDMAWVYNIYILD